MTQPLALVTGGAQRLGKAFASTLARMGYSIALHYHKSEEAARQTKAELEALGVQVHLLQADLTPPDQIQTLFENVECLTLNVLVGSVKLFIG